MLLATRLLSTLLLLAGACAAPAAFAQVQRCETADGRTVYTDKPCSAIDAVERVPRDAGGEQPAAHPPACARTLQALTMGLTLAIDARDANQLASFYHWPGIGTRAGYGIMDRLEAIAQRPLVDLRALYPLDPRESDSPDDQVEAATPSPPDAAANPAAPTRPPTASELMRSASPWRPSSTPVDAQTPPEPAPPASLQAADEVPRPQRTPYALQLEQTLANSGTPSRTVFGLRRHLGCWWISL